MTDRKKTTKRSAPDSEPNPGSQDSLLQDFDTLEVDSQQDDSASESLFKKPRLSKRRSKVPTESISSKKLNFDDEIYLPEPIKMHLLIPELIEDQQFEQLIMQEVLPLCGNYIMDLDAMVSALSAVATCKRCKSGEMQLFEMKRTTTCASQLVFRCNACCNAIIFMNVGEIGSKSTNILDLSSVLGSRLAGIPSEKLRTFSASMGLPPPPIQYHHTKIMNEVIIAAEKEANSSLERATKELESQIGIDPITKYVHVTASIDGAYNGSSCFSSKVIAYIVGTNKCSGCKLGAHKQECQAEYSDCANVHLESAIAKDLLAQAHKRGIVFDTLICDGDNDTVKSLNDSHIYKKLGIDLKIRRIECLAHVMRAMMNKLGNGEMEASKPSSVESPSNEIQYMTRQLSGNIARLYRLALQHNDGYPIRAKTEIDAIPLHLGANDDNASTNHRYCPIREDSWCAYQKAIYNSSNPPEHSEYLSEALVKHIDQLFSRFRYNDERFIQSLRYGITTNHNESLHHILSEIVPKKLRATINTMKLGAALAIIRYNDEYKAVLNIFSSFSQSGHFTRAQEAFRLHDNKRIMASGSIERKKKKLLMRKRLPCSVAIK